MFELRPVDGDKYAVDFLLWMLEQRDIALSISHRRMPTYAEHQRFVKFHPYKEWFIIWLSTPDGEHRIGNVYLTDRGEIGVFVAKSWQRYGAGEWAVREMMARHPGRRFLANINPKNEASIALFRKLGFFDCQITLQLVAPLRGDRSTQVIMDDPDGPVVSSPGTGVHPSPDDDEAPQAGAGQGGSGEAS